MRIEVLGPKDADRVLLDDTRVSPESLAAEIPIDPGAHTVKLVRDTETTGVSVSLADGEHRRVPLAPPLARPAPPPPPPRTEEKQSILASPWFWTVTGAVILGGTGAVASGYAGPRKRARTSSLAPSFVSTTMLFGSTSRPT